MLGSRSVVTFLGVWMVVNLVTGLVGFTPGVDGQIAWEAHIGGFLVGFFGIRAVRPARRELTLPHRAASVDLNCHARGAPCSTEPASAWRACGSARTRRRTP